MAHDSAAGISTSEFVRRGNDGREWTSRDKKSSTASFYSWMVDCRRLLMTKDEMTWLEQQTVPDRTVEVFVNMSCGTQLIPHVTLEIVDVLRALGVSFVAGTGPQFCCGKPFRTRERDDAGERVTQSSLGRFVNWGATTATHVCQSCQIIYTNHTAENESAAPRLTHFHFAEFLANRLESLGDRVPWKHRLDMRALVANCHAISPVHRASHENVARIMQMVPGVDVLGNVSTTSRGAPCTTEYPGGPSILAELDTPGHSEVRESLEQQAREAGGANSVVMHAHWCQREWQKFSAPQLSIKHFVSVVAEALGCSHPNRYEEFWHLSDPDAVVELSRPCWESWGLTESKARELAYKNFHPHFSGYLNAECACGGNPANCTTGKFTLLEQQQQ